MSNLLFNKHPIVVSQELAGALTELDPKKRPRISEATVLQQIHYWIEKKQNYRDGHYWVYNSLEDWTKQFTWIKTAKTMKRQLDWLEQMGILITGNYNKLKIDRTKWYTIDYDAFSRLVSPFTRNDQMEMVDTTKCKGLSQPNANSHHDHSNTIEYTKNTKDLERDVLPPSRQTEKLPLVAWPDSLGAMTGKIERLLLDVKQQGMSDKVIQKAIDLTKIAEPNTPYGYLKTILDDWLSQNIYTTHDWQALQKKKRDAKNREIPSIPIYKI